MRRNSITEEYEPLQPYYLLAAMKAARCASFADVGANIGVYSIFASQVDTVGKIIAFEANPSVANEMALNLELNSVDAEIRLEAVSDSEGEIDFGIVSKYAGNSGVASTSRGKATYTRTAKTRTVTLNDALKEVEFPLAIKIDVEGHEPNVIAGADELLKRGECIVQIEDYDGTLTATFERLGYRLLTQIGPDFYFTNHSDLDALLLFEEATRMLIESNHENKRVTVRRGGIGLELSGRPYRLVKQVAEKLMRSRL